MRYTFVSSRSFSSLVKSYGLSLEDVRSIENSIMEAPGAWPMVKGTGGVRKMRFASERSGGGKSGGYRVCYFVIDAHGFVYLMTIFSKSEAANLTAVQRNRLATLVREIKNFHRKEI